MEVLSPWRSQPVFVTSTFQDMQAERDHLLAHVFPAVDEWLGTRRQRLEWVDLRVGAAGEDEDEATRVLEILRVCLDEVRRARPFLIALVGDRYGVVPPAEHSVAAVEEIGFVTDVSGRSLTDLEIDFGILDDQAKTRRGLVFFRAPLPYDEMPPALAALYSDARALDAEAPLRAERLAHLKARLRRQAPECCFDYEVEWDPRAGRVTGLEEWGRMVEARLRAALEQEFGSDPVPVVRSWHEIEAEALAAFVEDRTRGFVGRQPALDRIERFLHSNGVGPRQWAMCVAGEAGAGKSAFFGEIYKRLVASRGPEAVVLVHAVGASTLETSIDAMARRFLHQLLVSPDSIHWFRFTESGDIVHKDVLDAGLAERASGEQLFAALELMLTWVAEVRDVVVMIDAMNQLDMLSQARFVAWAGRHWPRKARLIITTQPTEAAAALCSTVGVASLPLGPLDEQEARAITTEICARYHRRLPSPAMEAIVARRNPREGAWTVPLWLVTAAEQLNLLDADDFARARREYSGRDDQRIAAMMADLVTTMPPDVRGLYRTVIARAERTFGGATVSAFLGAIAVSRLGWRESDFRALMPALVGPSWDNLRFATLRRLFRGHLQLRRPLDRWDFMHHQLRATVRGWLAEIAVDERTLHTAAAHHLLALPPLDPVRISETMWHLLEAEDWTSAAQYLGQVEEGPELEGALAILVGGLRAPGERTREDFALRLTKLLSASALDDETIARIADRFNEVHHRSQGRASLASERNLLTAVERALAALLERHPRQVAWLKFQLRCVRGLGHLLNDGGDSDAAFQAYRRAEALVRRIAELDSAKGADGDPIAIGDVLFTRGKFQEALEYYRRAAATNASAGLGRVGVTLRMLGDFDGALAALRQDLRLLEQQIATNPRNQVLRLNLGIAYSTVASTLAAMGDLDGALQEYRPAMDLVAQVATANPLDPYVQSQWAQMHLRIAQVLLQRGDGEAALGVISQGQPIVDRILAAHDDNPHYWHDAGLFALAAGDALANRDDGQSALERWRAAENIFARLTAHDATNAQWRRELEIVRGRIRKAARTE